MANKRKVVVTGLGVVSSLGIEVKDNWERLLSGVSGIRFLEHPGAEASAVKVGGPVTNEDWQRMTKELPEDIARDAERRTVFALWAARSALSDAKLSADEGQRERCGVAFASGLAINRLEDLANWTTSEKKFDLAGFGREYDCVHAESIMRNNSNRPAALIAQKFDLRGMNFSITTACASGTQAIGMAFKAIQRGDTDVMLAGGADSMFNPMGLVFFVLLGAASISFEDPLTSCRPFDRKRSGLVMGEGSGFALLEEEGHALRRGANIYAEVAGFGTSMDAYQVTAPHPAGKGAVQSMRVALKDAGMAPDEIDYINAHGTSTKLNDTAETLAIKNLFGGHARKLAVNSSKSMTGHLLSASGGPEFIYTVLSTKHDVVHPTINLTHPDPKCDLDYVTEGKRPMLVRAGLSNSFGFGGQNASIIVRKYQNGRNER